MMREDRTCRDVRPLLDELIDGELDDARARAVRAHLRSCAACARREAATREVVEAAATLPPAAPPPELWQAISTKLDAEDERRGRPSPLFWWWHAWRRTLLAGGGALATAGVLLALWTGGARRPLDTSVATKVRAPASADAIYEEALRDVARAEQGYVAAIEELRQVAQEERRAWSPEAARAFDENLAAIDAAISRQAQAFRGAPGDPEAADALHASYRRKIDFLQESIVRGQIQ
jgi:anti-sigma factor RsiW